MNNEQYFIKLGDNFSDLIKNKIEEKIVNFEYFEALELLKTVGLEENKALGVLFGDYEIINTKDEIILVDNFSEPKLNLHKPIEKFISDYLSVYRWVLDTTCNILDKSKILYINIYDTDDKDFSILSKYFTIDLNYLMNPTSNGEIVVTSVKFYDTLYTAYNNGDYEELVESLSVSYNTRDLKVSCGYYFESRNILNIWNRIKKCVMFLSYYNYPHNFLILNKLSGIIEAFSQIYELITDETKYYSYFYN